MLLYRLLQISTSGIGIFQRFPAKCKMIGLKSDTATVAACALMHYLSGDFGLKLLDKDQGG